MNLPDNIELLTAEEYAKKFSVCRTTVFEWKKCGILIPGRHYIKIGRTLRFIWSADAIRELHENNAENINNNKKQAGNSPMDKTNRNNMSTINMEY